MAIGAVAAATTAIGVRNSLWADELWSLGLARLPLSQLWSTYAWGPEPNMTLYYLILHGWLGATSMLGLPPDETVVRLPSIMFAVLAASAVFCLGVRLNGRLVGLVAGSLFALNFLVLETAGNDARSYSLMLLLVTLSWLALFAIVERPTASRKWYVLYAAATGVSVYAHVISLLAFLAQGLTVAVAVAMARRRRAPLPGWLGPWMGSAAAAALIAAPFLVDGAIHGGTTNTWVWPAHLADIEHFLGKLSGQEPLYLLAVGIAAAAGIAATMRARPAALAPGDDEDRSLYGIGLVSWAAVPVAVSYALTQQWLNLHLYSPRYLVLSVPPLCLLAGLGVASLRQPRARAAAAVALVSLALLPLASVAGHSEKQDLRGAAAWVGQRYATGDGVVCLSWGAALAMEHYQPSLVPDGTPGRMSWTIGKAATVNDTTLAAYVPGHLHVFLVTDSDGPEAANASKWLGDRYHLIARHVAPALYGGTTVLEYETASSPNAAH